MGSGDSYRDDGENFQAAAHEQGERFSESCLKALREAGFSIMNNPLVVSDVGIELSCLTCTDHWNYQIWQFRGSWRGDRASLKRTDTVKKMIANGYLLRISRSRYKDLPHYVIYNDFPVYGSARVMIDRVMAHGIGTEYDLFSGFIDIKNMEELQAIAKIQKLK